MAGQSQTELSDDKYLLVSDSNEVGGQYDSKKLKQSELVALAQDNLFRKKLDIMHGYLTNDQYNNYKQVLTQQLSIHQGMWDEVEEIEWSGMFKPVDGQVILLRMDDVDEYNQNVDEYNQNADEAHQKSRKTPIEYLKWYWDIPSDFSVEQLNGCMLRGVTETNSKSLSDEDRRLPIKRPSNVNVSLTASTMPPHTHNSAITVGAGIQSMHGDISNNTSSNQNAIAYDMFYNDSFSTGVDDNEMEGVVDEFSVKDSGKDMVSHNNMPLYDQFYAFVIRKNTNA